MRLGQLEIEQTIPSRHNRTRKSGKLILFVFVLTFVVGLVLLGGLYYNFNTTEPDNPNWTTAYPGPIAHENGGAFHAVVKHGRVLDETVLLHNGQVYLPFSFFQSYIDPTSTYDTNSEQIIITTQDKVLTLRNQYLTNELKDEVVELQFPTIEVDGEIYLTLEPFNQIYPFAMSFDEKNMIVHFTDYNQAELMGKVKYTSEQLALMDKGETPELYLRSEPSRLSPIVAQAMDDEEVQIFEEMNDWYKVIGQSGVIGFTPKGNVSITGTVVHEWQKPERSFTPWNPIGGKINLTWEHVVRRTPDPSTIAPMPGVNVVSPTWFHIVEADGSMTNNADANYVRWAHQQGYQVWGLVTNNFDPDITHAVLTDYETRKRVILQLVHYANLYHLDGINIDFENVYLKDRENLVQFMRELTPYLHEQGLVVSIDVTIRSSSEMWSMFLDREALGKVVDYMMVMTYDEHWAASPVAGSVASLPWVERGLQGVLEQVPNDKLLLGIPFYTRIWTEELDANGQVTKVSSRAFSMGAIDNWLAEHKLTPEFDPTTGQYYAEYTDEDEMKRYKVWIEDETSMQQRIELVHKYDLAGVASWRRGFEKPIIWETIKKGLEQRLHQY